GRGLLQGLPVLHESGGHRPVAAPRLDRAPAEKNAAGVLGHAADDQPRVLIMDGAAGVADMPGEVIARRYAKLHPGAALRAEIHGLHEGYEAAWALSMPSRSGPAVTKSPGATNSLRANCNGDSRPEGRGAGMRRVFATPGAQRPAAPSRSPGAICNVNRVSA